MTSKTPNENQNEAGTPNEAGALNDAKLQKVVGGTKENAKNAANIGHVRENSLIPTSVELGELSG